MADRQLRVEISGNADKLNRVLGKTETRLQKFGKNVGMASGTAGFGGGTLLGGLATKGTAVAAGGALAALGIKRVISASMQAEVVLGQTGIAVDDAGLAWQTNAARIQAAALDISKATSFDDEAVLQSFQVFVRGQKDVEKSLTLAALAADVARGRYVDLDSATQLVNKAAMGQVGALRRAGIQIDKNATSTQALAALQRAYGGAAAQYANTTAGAWDKAKVALENFQEALGARALPEITAALQGTTDFGSEIRRIADITFPGSSFLGRLMDPGSEGFRKVLDEVALKAAMLKKQWDPGGFLAGLEAGRTATGTKAGGTFPAGPQTPFVTTDTVTGLTSALQTAILDAAATTGRKDDLKALANAKAFLEAARAALPPNSPDEALQIAQELSGVLSQIASIASEKKAAADAAQGIRDKKADDGREKAAADLKAAAEALAESDETIRKVMAEQIRTQTASLLDGFRMMQDPTEFAANWEDFQQSEAANAEALKDAAKELKGAGIDLKEATADRLRLEQQGVDAARAVSDTTDALKIARQQGGPEGIKAAARAAEDALRQRSILAALGVTWTQARGGMGGLGVGMGAPMGEQITIIINAAQDPEAIKKAVLEGLQRSGRLTSPQQRGRSPGRLPIGI